MRGDAGEGEKIVEREVPVADGVQAVPGDAGKAKLAAIAWRSMAKEFPASAPEPIGQESALAEAC